MLLSRITLSIYISFSSVLLFGVPIQVTAQPALKTAPAGTATVAGRVLLNGEPARGVTVGLQGQQAGIQPNNPLRAKTDEEGRYLITGIAAGRYSVMALAPGYVSTGNSEYGSRGKTVNIGEGENVENINIELKRGGVITGRVTDTNGRPVVEESIVLSRLDKNGRASRVYEFGLGMSYDMFMTDDRGVYRLYGLPADRYLVSVGVSQEPGSIYVSRKAVVYARTFHPDAVNQADAKAVEVTEGSESTGVDITVAESKPTYEIAGRVVSAETGQPVPGVSISYGTGAPGGNRISSWGSNGERSRMNGEFRLVGVLPGKYGVFAGSENDKDFISDPVMCEVTQGDVAGIELRVRQGASIRGFVAIEGVNDPKLRFDLTRMMIYTSMRPNPGESSAPSSYRPTNITADGSFQIRGLSQGKADIRVMGQSVRGLSFARVEHNGVIQREGIEVKYGEQVSGVKLVMVYGALKLHGEVKFIGWAPGEGQMTYIAARRTDQPNSPSFSAIVDIRGKFVIESLPPGEYELSVHPSFVYGAERPDPHIQKVFDTSARQKVAVSSDNHPPITFVLDFTRKEGEQ
jgi:Carboxypeptidase regulatory-like domain